MARTSISATVPTSCPDIRTAKMQGQGEPLPVCQGFLSNNFPLTSTANSEGNSGIIIAAKLAFDVTENTLEFSATPALSHSLRTVAHRSVKERHRERKSRRVGVGVGSSSGERHRGAVSCLTDGSLTYVDLLRKGQALADWSWRLRQEEEEEEVEGGGVRPGRG